MKKVNHNMTFREMLGKTLEIKNMTYDDLAIKLGVTKQSVSLWSNGKSEPNRITKHAIIQILSEEIDNIPDDELLHFQMDNIFQKSVDDYISNLNKMRGK